MKKIRAAIVGYGNIGKYVLEALEAAPDFEVAGVVRRNPNDIPDELKGYTVTDTITKLDKVDVAVLATPTRSVETYAKEILSLGINTVDSFDIHGGIVDLRRSLDAVAKAHNTVAVISLPDGIREATQSFVLCCRRSFRKELHIRISDLA